MKSQVALFMIVLILVGGCSPRELFGSTVTPSPTQTASPTPTLIPTKTPTPTITPSPTPIPTPMGGGDGKLLFFQNLDLFTVNADGTGMTIIHSRQEILDSLSINSKEVVRNYVIVSPDGQKFAMGICGSPGCYTTRKILSYLDFSHTKTIDNLQILQWSPTSDKLLLQTFSTAIGPEGWPLYVVGVTEDGFGKAKKLPNASHAFWSYDGEQIYYYYARKFYVINSDGTGNHVLKCDLCEEYVTSVSAGAPSPDGKKIAVGYWGGGLIIVNADFTNAEELSIGGYVDELYWSPNGKLLLVNTGYIGQRLVGLKIVKTEDNTIIDVPIRVSAEYLYVCGWSPDSRLISYITWTRFDTMQQNIKTAYVQDIETGTVFKLAGTDYGDVSLSCPIWLSENVMQ